MKKSLLFFICLVLTINITMAQQTTKRFNCELFSFRYPSTFKTERIYNAPHMYLKISSPKYLVTLSGWNKMYGPDVSIWDDELYESSLNIPVNGELVSVDKIVVETQQGKRRAIRIQSKINGEYSTTYSVSYLMINSGYLFLGGFFSGQNIFKASELIYQQRILRGLSFKQLISRNDEFKDYVMETVKGLNAQCPIKTDEITTLKNIFLSGKTVCIKMMVPSEYIELIDFSIFKSTLCENFSQTLEKSFVLLLKQEGYSVSYFIFDEADKLYQVLTISPQEILDNYE